MDYFDKQGHLTKFAFERLIEGEKDELRRLEITEHLSFCDLCLDQYMEKMSEAELLPVPKTMEKSLFYALKIKGRKMIYNRYASMTVAASLAMALWLGGAFDISIKHFKTLNEQIKIERCASENLNDRFLLELEKVMEVINYGKEK